MSDQDGGDRGPLTDDAESPLGPIKDHDHDLQRVDITKHPDLGTETRKEVCRDPGCEYKRWRYRTNEQQELAEYGHDN